MIGTVGSVWKNMRNVWQIGQRERYGAEIVSSTGQQQRERESRVHVHLGARFVCVAVMHDQRDAALNHERRCVESGPIELARRTLRHRPVRPPVG